MDVLIENFRPGAMDRLGLGYEAMHQRNPRLVYCSISGYGQNGPSRDEAAMDLVVQSSSGLLSITGTEQGESVRCGYGVTDVTAGLFSVIGILLALRARESTGIGQYVDVSMLDSMISTMSSNYMSYLGSGDVPKPMGTAFPTVVPYRVFHDGRSCGGDCRRQRETLVRLLPRDRAAGSGAAPGLRDQRGAHPEPRNARAAAGRCVPHAVGGGMDRALAGGRHSGFARPELRGRGGASAIGVQAACSRRWTIPRPVATALPARR